MRIPLSEFFFRVLGLLIPDLTANIQAQFYNSFELEIVGQDEINQIDSVNQLEIRIGSIDKK